MIELKEKIKLNFVFIKNQGVHVGCGFFLPVNDEIYCVTAGHVVFGKDFDSELELDIYDISGKYISNTQCITDLSFARDFDLAVLRIESTLEDIEDVVITTPVINSSLQSLSYVKAQALSSPYFINPIVVDEKLDGNRVRYKVPSGSFNNFVEDEHGADAMEGISGSPVFLCTPDASIVFYGVIDKIPNQGVGGLVEVRGLEPIVQIIDGLKLKPVQDFDESTNLIRFNTKLTEKDNFLQWVDKWKNAPGNQEYYSNLEMKLETIFGDSYVEELPIELENIMIGDECVKSIIERDSQLHESYKDVIRTAEREKKLAFVSNKQEAYDHYQTIYKDHLDVVKKDLSEYNLRQTDLKKIAQRDVSTWLAVCNLRFEKKMTIYIEKKEYKNFVIPRMLDSYRIAVILLLIDSSISGSAKYIYLDKLYFLFDLLICDQEFTGFPKFTIPPWNIDKELKNTLIILTQNKLIEQSYDGNKVRYSLTKEGSSKVEEIKSVDELSLVIEKADKLAASVKTSAFNKSKVIF